MTTPSPETVARVRADYARGMPTATIMKDYNIKRRQLYAWLEGKYDDGSGRKPPAIALRRPMRSPIAGQAGASDPHGALTRRLWRAVKNQMREAERRLRGGALSPEEREREARTLATLARTLCDLSATGLRKQAGAMQDDMKNNDDSVPRNVDDLRQELARRLDQLVTEATRLYPEES